MNEFSPAQDPVAELKQELELLRGNLKNIAHSTDLCVRENAWAAVGIAAAAGLFLGLVMSGSDSRCK